MEDISFPRPKLHIFVCVNERPLGGKPSCCPTITPEMVKDVKQWLVSQGLSRAVYCTKVKCLGFCNVEGGVACVYPQGRFVKGLRSGSDIQKLIVEELNRV